jgi:N-acetylglucosamine PTS system EIICBA or EIICB component
VVLGPIADQVAGEIRDAMRAEAGTKATRHDAPAHQDAPPHQDALAHQDTPALLAALGGRQNVGDVEILAGRLSMRIADPKAVDERALIALGIRGVAHPTAGSVQLLIPGSAEAWAQPLRRLLA